jgi:exopolysaccharide biosynthesis polyprenyl glycosylphosphotransferase
MFKLFGLHVSQWKLLLLLGDIVAYIISVIIALYLYIQTSSSVWEYLFDNKLYFTAIGITYILVIFMADLYNHLKDYRETLNIVNVLIASCVGTIVVLAIFYFPMRGAYIGRSVILLQAFFFALLMTLWRWVFSVMAFPQRLQKRILIIGAGKSGKYLLNSIRERPGCGFWVAGFVDDDPEKVGTEVEGVKVLGDSSRLADLINEHQISFAVVAITRKKSPALVNNLIMVSWTECQLIDMPTIYEFITGTLPTEHISDDWIFDWNVNKPKIYYRRIKRFTDLILAGVFLIITSPLMLLIPLIIKIDSKGPVFFCQQRLCQKGKTFQIMKFRTMIQNAEQCGPLWTVDKDPRITRAGRFIRKLRLDELPQLINILKGEMSFIGPRPLAHCEVMDNIRYYNYRLLVKPGITGWAQVMYPDGIAAEIIAEKVKYDLYYIKNISFLMDMAILLKTVRIILFGRGI